jgi:hypothetical protein
MLRRLAIALSALGIVTLVMIACVADDGSGVAVVCKGSDCNDGGETADTSSPAVDSGGGVIVDAGSEGAVVDATPQSDGSCTHPCNGDVVWLRGFGSTVGDAIYEARVDAAGNMYIVGSAGGPFAVGADGGAPSVAGGYFVLKLDKDGNAVWVKNIGGAVQQPHIAVSSTALYVAGTYFKNTVQTGAITWGGTDTGLGSNVGTSGYDIYVLETDLDGTKLAVTQIGADGYDEMNAVGVDSDGSPVIYGNMIAAITYRTKAIAKGPFVLEMTTALDPKWVCTIGLAASSTAVGRSIRSLTGQGLYVAGNTTGTVTWCGKTGGNNTEQMGFVLHLQSSDGSVAAGTSNPNFAYGNFNIGQTTSVNDVAAGTNAAGAGGIYFTGSFQGSVSIGSPATELLADDGGLTDKSPAAYVGLFDKTTLNPLAGRGIVDNAVTSQYALAFDGLGGLAVGGLFKGTVDYGAAAALTSAGDTDGVIALYDPLLKKPTWIYRMGGPVTDSIVGVGTDTLGNVYAAGQWQGTADFPDGKMRMSNGGVTNLFVMKLAH